jgi:septal ring factor EnvC (AmiA/AmiB activator)
LLSQTQKTIAQLDPIMGDIQKTTSTLPGTTKSLEMSVKALPGTVIQMQETLLQIQRLVEAAQKTWMLRSYVDQGHQGRRINPNQVNGAGE